MKVRLPLYGIAIKDHSLFGKYIQKHWMNPYRERCLRYSPEMNYITTAYFILSKTYDRSYLAEFASSLLLIWEASSADDFSAFFSISSSSSLLPEEVGKL